MILTSLNSSFFLCFSRQDIAGSNNCTLPGCTVRYLRLHDVNSSWLRRRRHRKCKWFHQYHNEYGSNSV